MDKDPSVIFLPRLNKASYVFKEGTVCKNTSARRQSVNNVDSGLCVQRFIYVTSTFGVSTDHISFHKCLSGQKVVFSVLNPCGYELRFVSIKDDRKTYIERGYADGNETAEVCL